MEHQMEVVEVLPPLILTIVVSQRVKVGLTLEFIVVVLL